MSTNTVKVAVTGAAGQIGYALLFRLASGEMFGPDVAIDLRLLELETALPALIGVVLELEDCAFPLLKKILPTASVEEAFSDIDWALLVGSVPRKAGMERKDLIRINAPVFVEQGQALSAVAKTSCKVLVVGNPCNTNAYIAKTAATRIPDENFCALTLLDQKRAEAQLAAKAQVSINDVKNLIIWGNHSLTQYPDFYNATIHGQPAVEVISDETWLQTTFIQTVQKRGAAVIKARGVSSAASAANAVLETVKALRTQNGVPFSVGVVSDGSYQTEKGLVFSFPVVSQGQGLTIVQDIPLTDFARDKIQQTQQELLEERESIRALIKGNSPLQARSIREESL